MSNKIKLLGVRDLQSDDQIQANTDYGILLIASRISCETPDSFTDEEEKDDIIYRLKIERIDAIYNLKDQQPVQFEHGRTPSQKLRFRIETALSKDDYQPFINYLISHLDQLTEDYLESIKK
jgi:hypothetical protein